MLGKMALWHKNDIKELSKYYPSKNFLLVNFDLYHKKFNA